MTRTHVGQNRIAGRNRIAGVSLLLVLVSLLAGFVPAHAAAPRYFAETQHTMQDPILSYWDTQGGLPVFGYPISEAFMERNADTGTQVLTQYVERTRMESHPQNQPPYHVLLGLLGKEALAQQGRDWTSFPKASPSAAHYYGATGHAIDERFWGYFRGHGLEFDGVRGSSEAESIALFGLPISEPQMETNGSGDTVLTQWFERARFEFHPQNPAPYTVLLGLLGSETTATRRAEAPFQPTVQMDEIHANGKLLFDYFNQRRQQDYGKPAAINRADLQADADQLARDWTQVRQAGGDDRAVLDAWNAIHRALPGAPTAVYLTVNAPLEAGCKGIDPALPIRGAYSFWVAQMDVTTLTIGVAGPYQGPCGRAMTVVYVIGFDY